MRLPFTLAESSVIRSGARIFLPILGLGAVLWGLYAITGILEKAVFKDSEKSGTEELIESISRIAPDSIRALPLETTLRSTEGNTLDVTILSRPTSQLVTFRRDRDGEIFTIPLSRLSKKDRARIREIPEAGKLTEMIARSGIDLASLLGTEIELLPRRETLTDHNGRSIKTLLIERPNEREITFQRLEDNRVFTIPVKTLSVEDQKIISKLPLSIAD